MKIFTIIITIPIYFAGYIIGLALHPFLDGIKSGRKDSSALAAELAKNIDKP